MLENQWVAEAAGHQQHEITSVKALEPTSAVQTSAVLREMGQVDIERERRLARLT